MDSKEAERITINMSSELAAYVKGQAIAELRTVSNMIAYMVEAYRRNHEGRDKTSAQRDTMPSSTPKR
jgi:hypothetical protein